MGTIQTFDFVFFFVLIIRKVQFLAAAESSSACLLKKGNLFVADDGHTDNVFVFVSSACTVGIRFRSHYVFSSATVSKCWYHSSLASGIRTCSCWWWLLCVRVS